MSQTPGDLSETACIENAIQGNVEAFGQLYDRYVNQIYNFIFYQVSSREEAEDLTEQVFLKAFEKLPDFRTDKVMTNFRAWIYRIARNLVIDHYRTQKNTVQLNPEMPLQSDEPALSDKIEAIQDFNQVIDVLKSLDEPFRQVLVMRFLQEMSYKEIASVMQIKENYVRVLQYRGLKKIRARIGGL